MPEEVSIWSGSNGSGKSTVLSQIAIECINQGFKCAVFSGELNADKVLEWVMLQCAGKKYTKGTQYENYFRVQETVRESITKWLDGKIYIYNNKHGNNVNMVLKGVMECIKENKINMVIIDNMMSLDVASIGGEKYDRQTTLVIALTELFVTISKIPVPVLEIIVVLATVVASITLVVKVIKSVTDTANVIGGFFGAVNPVTTKTVAIIMAVVAALIALATIITVISGKSGDLQRSMTAVGDSVGKVSSTVYSVPQNTANGYLYSCNEGE